MKQRISTAGRWAIGVGLALGWGSPRVSGEEQPSPPRPAGLVVRGGDGSVLLHWEAIAGQDDVRYEVYRAEATGGGHFTTLTVPALETTAFADNTVNNGVAYQYRVTAVGRHGISSPPSEAVTATPRPFANDDAFLEYLAYAAFQYFWREANPANGLVRDRNRADSVASIAATGFGLTALGIGVDRGWITRPEGRSRALQTLRTFWEEPQGDAVEGMIGHRGWFYHFLDPRTARRTWRCELSSIDTALLLAGIVYARNYFDQASTDEVALRDLADRIYGRIDWEFMATGTHSLSMGWRPETGFIHARWIGYNEAMILYVLGLGASVRPLPAEHWATWTGGYRWASYYGQEYVEFAPLFGHQYSHCWIDFRGIADDYLRRKRITYFENSRRATLAQRSYCLENPGRFAGYGAEVWGLTACDGPGTPGYFAYMARGAPPPENDDGTIAPTAVGGSLPFAPEICLPALRHLYDRYRAQLWTGYGYRDAFNLTAGWWGPDVLGIDQGAILLMVENHRTGSVWRVFMREPAIQRGLAKAGFATLE
jgi:hypothetical protein